MRKPAPRQWTVDEFFAWQEGQAERYELVDGLPLRMMAGARNVHDDIVVNVLTELRNQLRGGPCRPFTADGSIETKPGQIRRPDLGVDCGRRDPNGFKAENPRMLAEVLSPTTRDFDTYAKLGEYKEVGSIEWILLIEPNEPLVVVFARDDERKWQELAVRELGRAIEMPGIGVALKLADIYEGIEFPVGPKLVYDRSREP